MTIRARLERVGGDRRFPGRPGRWMEGVTLFELVVVLAIMGILTTLIVPRWLPGHSSEPRTAGATALAQARREAVLTASAVTVDVVLDGRSWTVTALPDGRIVAPSGFPLLSLSLGAAEPGEGP